MPPPSSLQQISTPSSHHHHPLLSPQPNQPPTLSLSPSSHSKLPTLNCRLKIHTPLAKQPRCDGIGRFGAGKVVDVATLSNLCVDIVINVPQLPPELKSQRQAYMDQLAKSPPHKSFAFVSSWCIHYSVKFSLLNHQGGFLQSFWEAGGSCNVAIAAARLGLRCVSVGHLGSDVYGEFLRDVLHDEGINIVGVSEQNNVNIKSAYETLVCWVLVDPFQQHGFCSQADFLEEPACSWLSDLSTGMKTSIEQSKILFCNGFGFDELTPNLLVSAMEYAIEVGTSIFFDPGPRIKSLASGTLEEQKALHKLLQMSDVLFLTSEEAESLTGFRNPILAGQECLSKGVRTKWVIIKTGSKGSVLITRSSIYCAPAFKVSVIDTVGCGDSFVAAVAFGFIHNMPLMSTLTLANAVGSATAMGCGAGRNVATRKQVMELIKGENLNEDDKFWNELLIEQLEASDITMLSKMDVNISSKLKHVPIQKVVSEMLPELESILTENALH